MLTTRFLEDKFFIYLFFCHMKKINPRGNLMFALIRLSALSTMEMLNCKKCLYFIYIH